jgi:hypothetical protein
MTVVIVAIHGLSGSIGRTRHVEFHTRIKAGREGRAVVERNSNEVRTKAEWMNVTKQTTGYRQRGSVVVVGSAG